MGGAGNSARLEKIMERIDEQHIEKELRSMGYFHFSWGDFWKTGCTARIALRKTEGKHQSTSKNNPIMWDTRPGPRGGCWIRYYRSRS